LTFGFWIYQKGAIILKSVRVGVIGVGNIGQHHVRICSELPQIKLVGIVDVDESKGRQVALRYGVPFYPEYKDLFKLVDAVSIAAPTSYHYEIALECLKNGIHVLVEKPITVELEQARQLVEMATKKDLILLVGHLERFNPAVRQFKLMLKKPNYIEAHRLSYPVLRNLDVGVVWDLMIHDLDIMIDLVRSPIEQVNAMGLSVYSTKEDLAMVQLLFKNGCLANLIASRVSGERSRKLSVIEDKKTFTLDLINQSLVIMRPPRGDHTNPPEFVPIKKEEPLRLELQHFAECVLMNKTPLVTGEDGKRALELAMRVMSSMSLAYSTSDVSEKVLATAKSI
jgi:predicted dehydrogenase